MTNSRLKLLPFSPRKKELPFPAARKQVIVNEIMVGTARFELATSRTPSVRATRLRHVPSKPFQYGAKRSFVKRRTIGCWNIPNTDDRSIFRFAHRFQFSVALIEQIQDLAKLVGNLLQ
jgi:hypothetical protein